MQFFEKLYLWKNFTTQKKKQQNVVFLQNFRKKTYQVNILNSF